MDDTASSARALFLRGFNCSQAVFAAHRGELGLDEGLALRLACPFGGGLTGRQGTCGALYGAILVLGGRHGKARDDDNAAKERTYALVREFETAFVGINGAGSCRDLLGYDWSSPEGKARHLGGDDRSRVCLPCVESSARLLAEARFK
jgi:C_GCAxxG_C_C family probable redox protein